MKKLNGLSKKHITGQRKIQLGNSLVPVIIALAISALASVAFLDQGSNLAKKNKQLLAQYEIAEALQTWKRIKKLTPIPLPAMRSNAFGGTIKITGLAATHYEILYEAPEDPDSCNALASMFDPSMKGISSQTTWGASSNPTCFPNSILFIRKNTVRIRLD